MVILYGCTRKEGALVRQFNDITGIGNITTQLKGNETKWVVCIVVNTMFTVIYIRPSLGQLH